MTIKVTAKHIELGIRARCTQCPVALALRDATGVLWFVFWNNDHHSVGNFQESTRYYLPLEISQRIKRYDDELEEMTPFEFELDTPSYNHPVA